MSQMIAAADCFFKVASGCNDMTSIFRKSILTEKYNDFHSTYWDYSRKPVGYRRLNLELVSNINWPARDMAYLCLFNVALGFWL